MKKISIILAIMLCVSLLSSCNVAQNGGNDVNGTKMIAKITAIDEKLEVEVIEGEYGATGPYWVITSSDTVYLDKSGNATLRAFLKPGDIIEITYGGQVMMSYPPQIVALKIQIK